MLFFMRDTEICVESVPLYREAGGANCCVVKCRHRCLQSYRVFMNISPHNH